MKKILLLSLTIILLTSCSIIPEKIENSNNSSGTSLVNENQKVEEIGEEIELSKQEKIKELRKKIALKGLIIKGKINIRNKDYTSALIKYIQIHKEIPNDKDTIMKLGDIYFNLKKYKQSYSYYSKIKKYKKLDSIKAVKSLIFSMSLNTENITKINTELDTLNLTKEELFYYKNSITCKADFHICKQNFQDFFEEKKKLKKELKSNSGTGNIEEYQEFKSLANIEKAIENYNNFQVDDLFYKGALITSAFFENRDYSIAIEVGKLLLNEKSDYKPLLKLVAKSYYELGNYIEAKKYLIKYNKLVKEDKEVSYFLGVIYEKLNDYMLSTIHFKKAIKVGYEENIDINKRLLYNYYRLDQIDKMLEMLKKIIEENKDELIIDDYSLAIYYHIINEKIDDAESFTQKALKKFPESEIINGYMGWILMEKANKKAEIINMSSSGAVIDTDSNIDFKNTSITSLTGSSLDSENPINQLYNKADIYINKGLEINSNSPMINLVKGKLESSKGNYRKAFLFFKKTVSLDNNGDFGKIAKQELKNIEINKENNIK